MNLTRGRAFGIGAIALVAVIGLAATAPDMGKADVYPKPGSGFTTLPPLELLPEAVAIALLIAGSVGVYSRTIGDYRNQ